MNYKTPNVYVEEVATLPPSVAGVATAVPAFIGFTEKAGNNGKDLTLTPTKISSFKEYVDLFGMAKASGFEVRVSASNKNSFDITSVTAPKLTRLMYYSVRMYFNNGGESCYIVSAGNKTDGFTNALAELRKEDEPTLLVFPDASRFDSVNDYHQLCIDALAQCAELKDRFTIMDVVGDVTEFRSGISSDYLKYGAAYCPDLQTSLPYHYTDDSVTITCTDGLSGSRETTSTYEGSGLKITYTGSGASPVIKCEAKAANASVFDFEVDDRVLLIKYPGKTDSQTSAKLLEDWTSKKPQSSAFDIEAPGGNTDLSGFLDAEKEIRLGGSDTDGSGSIPFPCSLSELAGFNTDLFNKIRSALSQKRVVLPPSAAIAGVYSRVDRDRGVWKAPANVTLSSVIGPVRKITDKEQEDLNVDPTSGKSVNAIRSFTGKGTLVWGARTLAGNDNEWRYVPVRRLFNYIEESIQKATAFAVFEPNTAMTWLKVRTMIESFLDDLWRQGAFAGATQDQAFYVHAGLGTTMTEQDILEGRMIVEIGVAAVRPAEFIILRFSHKLQEA